MKSPLYRIICQLCSERYIGESCRTVHDRLSEHLRFANNPSAPSYLEEAMAVHYRGRHEGEGPDLKFEVIRTESNTILRKIFEAYFIYNQKPEIKGGFQPKKNQKKPSPRIGKVGWGLVFFGFFRFFLVFFGFFWFFKVFFELMKNMLKIAKM